MKDRVAFLLFLAIFAISVYAGIPPGYYDSVAGKSGAELKTAIHYIIKPHKRIDYGAKGTWVVFRTSDVRSDGSIWDMYSNVVRHFPESGSHPEMHIEHSVPKSWWGDKSPFKYEASYDLHHLVPSDASTNMSKSNRVLGEVDEGLKGAVRDNGVSKTGKAKVKNKVYPVFEPHDEYKGDFARMYMYVATCYQDYTWVSNGVDMFNSEPYPTLNEYSVELLMRWHRQDPVSAKEMDRNEAVYLVQDNRNPFIDFPLLAEYLWGDSIGCAFALGVAEKFEEPVLPKREVRYYVKVPQALSVPQTGLTSYGAAVCVDDEIPVSVVEKLFVVQSAVDKGVLSLCNLLPGSRVLLYDMQGVLCKDIVVQDAELVIERCSPGMYILEVVDKENVVCVKVIL